MKVNQLLTVKHLKGITVIAGENGINREVTSVNMMDAPDIIHFLNENEFLVTTAYHYKDQPHLLTTLVDAMARQKCAGLGIKTKRFLDQVPKEVIEKANELSLPILELPFHLSLGEIANHSLRAILDHRARELTYALETHKQFTKIIMEGKGVEALLQNLSTMIHRPTQLVDQHFKPILSHLPVHLFPIIKDRMTFSTTMTTPISFSVPKTKETYTLFPMIISNRNKGFLMIKGTISENDFVTSLTIEQATNVISFSLMKDSALRQQARNIRNDFFNHFLDGTISSAEQILGRASEFSLINERSYICAVGKIDTEEFRPTFAELHEKTDDIYNFIEGEISNEISTVHFFTKGELCILLFEAQASALSPSKCFEKILCRLQDRVFNYYQNSISFGVSNLCHTFLLVKNAYKDALDSLSHGKFSRRTAFIQTYQAKDITELLRTVPQEDLLNFYSFSLGRFNEIKEDDKRTLLETLSVYLETHSQISETAKRLFVHRNTVVYRIEKCEEILGINLKDSEITLQLRLALRISKLLEM